MQKKTKLLWLILYFIGMIAVFALSESTIDFSSDDFWGFIFLTESCYTVTFLTVLFVKELSYPSEQKVNSNIFNAPEEFNNILQYMEERNLLDFGTVQKKLAAFTFLRRINFIIMVVAFLIIYSEIGDLWEPFYYIGPGAFIISLIFVYVFGQIVEKDIHEFVYMYKKEIIPTLLNQMNNNLNYVAIDPEKLEEYETLYKRSEFSRDSEYIKAEDFIEGLVVADITVRMADMLVSKEGDDGGNVKIFEGLFAHFKNVNYDSMKEISIRTSPDYGKLDSLKVITGNEEFDKNFIVYTSNEDAVVAMRSTGFLDAIMELRKKHDCKFEIIIREGEIYIQIPLINVFEPNVMDMTGGRKTLYKHYQHYKLFFDIFHITRNFIEC